MNQLSKKKQNGFTIMTMAKAKKFSLYVKQFELSKRNVCGDLSIRINVELKCHACNVSQTVLDITQKIVTTKQSNFLKIRQSFTFLKNRMKSFFKDYFWSRSQYYQIIVVFKRPQQAKLYSVILHFQFQSKKKKSIELKILFSLLLPNLFYRVVRRSQEKKMS